MSQEIKKAIERYHSDYAGTVDGALIFELATGTGYAHGEPNRIDAFHMALKPSEALKRTAYEIKTSRSDFRREIQEPRKRRAAMRVSNQFFFVAPVGVIPHAEIPLDCGLMEFDGTRIFVTIQAPYRDSLPASWHFFAAFARRLIRAADPVKA